MESLENRGDTFEVDGVTFEAVEIERVSSRPDYFSVRKTARMIELYRELAPEFRGAQIIELGIDQGASTAMIALLFEPGRLSALDISGGPIEPLDAFIRDRQLDDVVHLYWGVDQSERAKLLSLVDSDFGGRPLDLVIDDASHFLGPTTTSFEALFPRLRPGGLFIIEDWSHEHEVDRLITDILERNDEEAKKLEATLAAVADEYVPQRPLSQLVAELVLVSGYAPDVIASVRVEQNWCEVRRGPASLPSPFVLRNHLGSRGCEILPDHHAPQA